MGHAGASRKSPNDAPWETLSLIGQFLHHSDSCSVMETRKKTTKKLIIVVSHLLFWKILLKTCCHKCLTRFDTIGAFACSGFSRPEWISVAKLLKSAAEKRDPKKHLSFSVAI